jgi:hypothetical protein
MYEFLWVPLTGTRREAGSHWRFVGGLHAVRTGLSRHSDNRGPRRGHHMIRLFLVIALVWLALMPPFFTDGACTAEFGRGNIAA